MPRKNHRVDGRNYHVESSDLGMTEEEYAQSQVAALGNIFEGYNYAYLDNIRNYDEFLHTVKLAVENSCSDFKDNFLQNNGTRQTATSNLVTGTDRGIPARLSNGYEFGFDPELCSETAMPKRTRTSTKKGSHGSSECASWCCAREVDPLTSVLRSNFRSTIVDLINGAYTDRPCVFGLSRRCAARCGVGPSFGCLVVEDEERLGMDCVWLAGDVSPRAVERGHKGWLKIVIGQPSVPGKSASAVARDCDEYCTYRMAIREVSNREKRLARISDADDKAYRQYVVRVTGGEEQFKKSTNGSERTVEADYTLYRNYTTNATNPYLLSRTEWFAQHRKPELLRAIHADLAEEKAQRKAAMAEDRAYEEAMWCRASWVGRRQQVARRRHPQQAEGSRGDGQHVSVVAAGAAKGQGTASNKRSNAAALPTSNRFGVLKRK